MTATETIAAYFAADSTMTANQCLAALGLTKHPIGKHGGRYEYMRGDHVVFVGGLTDLNEWLRAGMSAADGVEALGPAAEKA